jgi:hypothetical protein
LNSPFESKGIFDSPNFYRRARAEGRYAPSETNLTKFNVEGEQRYWVHVAIDRFTGQVIDKQIEVVNE